MLLWRSMTRVYWFVIFNTCLILSGFPIDSASELKYVLKSWRTSFVSDIITSFSTKTVLLDDIPLSVIKGLTVFLKALPIPPAMHWSLKYCFNECGRMLVTLLRCDVYIFNTLSWRHPTVLTVDSNLRIHSFTYESTVDSEQRINSFSMGNSTHDDWSLQWNF